MTGNPVGVSSAREIHGLSAGGQVVVIGRPGSAAAAVRALCSVDTATQVDETDLTRALMGLAEVAAESVEHPLVVVDGGLHLSVPALLDLLDRPGVTTAALTAISWEVQSGVEAMTPVRTSADGSLLESVGSSFHVVSAPTHVLPGVLRVAGADRAAAAAAWSRAAADAQELATGDPGAMERNGGAFAYALVALVRTGAAVGAVPTSNYTWHNRRRGAKSAGWGGSAWDERLRASSRGNDGFVSTMLVRPLSRRVTRLALARGWRPDAVTATSLGMGVASALLVLTGSRWCSVIGAVLLLGALVVDCVDGEVARFSRRFSAFGAWLDALGDRVKEYSVIAALGAVMVRSGQDGWVLAAATMAVITLRHLEDSAYSRRQEAVRRPRVDRVPFSIRSDRGGAVCTVLPALPTPTAVRTDWAKKVVHLPIAERYVLLALGLVALSPRATLWLLLGATVLSVAWTNGGRTMKALLGRDAYQEQQEAGTHHKGGLEHELDLGLLAMVLPRGWALPFPVGAVCAAVALTAALAGMLADLTPVVLAGGVAMAVLIPLACSPPLQHRLAWQAPSALWAAEALLATLVMVHDVHVGGRGPLFAYLAAVAYHRYDVVYRLRDLGAGPPQWLVCAGLGVEVRLLLILLAGVTADSVDLGWAAALAAAYLGLLFLGESVSTWYRRLRVPSQPTTVRVETEG